MDETFECARVRPLLAELATGAATGIDRDRGLRHVETCVGCQLELAELALTADQLLLLVPEREPPAGFEAAVMNRIAGLTDGRTPPLDPPPSPTMRGRRLRRPRRTPVAPRGPSSRRERRPGRIVAGCMALLLAAGLGAGGAYLGGGPDRRLADRYRNATAAGAGYTNAAPVTTVDGTVVGRLYLYQGAPAWAIVALTAAPAAGAWDMSVVTRGGLRYPMGVCTVTGHSGVRGYALPMPVDDIAAVDLDHAGIRLTVRPL
jgi:hypothetical protein